MNHSSIVFEHLYSVLANPKTGDSNMDSQVNNSDKEMMWQPNAGKGSQVPE
ncbi:MAG: hypothetical protein K8R68_00100 [Bacteroidales bacterium]|nr:hypothetical protein [Bacteroidales bacterium]